MRAALGLLAGLQLITISLGVAINSHLIALIGLVDTALVVWLFARVLPLREELAKFRHVAETELNEHVHQRTEHLLTLVQKYERESLTDPLTGLLNRRGGEDAISKHLSSTRRSYRPMSFILIDLDHFKKVNDTHGHETGDTVLSTVARTLVAALRQADLSIRWGGEELLAALPNTDLQGAVYVAEKLRRAISEIVFSGFRITASLGVAEISSEEDLRSVVAKADMHLYIAKAKGRNCVSPDPEEITLRAPMPGLTSTH